MNTRESRTCAGLMMINLLYVVWSVAQLNSRFGSTKLKGGNTGLKQVHRSHAVEWAIVAYGRKRFCISWQFIGYTAFN